MDSASFRVVSIVVQFLSCLFILPFQFLILYILLRHKDLRNNASYRILARLVFLDLVQALCLLLSAFYLVFPSLAAIEALRKFCSVVLISWFMAIFPLQLELVIYRMLVVTKKADPSKLPLPFKVLEGIVWLFILYLSIGTWIEDAYVFQNEQWVFNSKSKTASILSAMDIFYCIPFLLVTYVLYTFLYGMIFSKSEMFTRYKNGKEEMSLFLQSTTTTLCYIVGICLYHIPDLMDLPLRGSPWFVLFNSLLWTASLYWCSLFLLIFNKTIRSKIWKPSFSTAVISLITTT